MLSGLKLHDRFVIYMTEFFFNGCQCFRFCHELDCGHNQPFDEIESVIDAVFGTCRSCHLRCVSTSHRVRIFTDFEYHLDCRCFVAYIARYNGNVTEVEEWGKKKLAYEIQKMHEGFYYFIQFEADAQCPAEVERHVRIMDNVLRYLVVRKDA